MATPAEITDQLKAFARQLGFALVGACPAVQPSGASRLLKWLERGYGGQMEYFRQREHAYQHPDGVLLGTKSLLMLAFPYRTVDPQGCSPGTGRVSRYAWGPADYHDLIHDRLKKLLKLLRELVPHNKSRGVVDSAPLLEREFAQLAGMGWQGKHTLLLNRQAGSYFFLAAILTDQELAYDQPFEADHCGTCRACLDACPTNAFPEPYVLDATRCISYLTIELREAIPAELRTGIGDWLFGCDVCQEVCPWNDRPTAKQLPAGSESLQPEASTNPLDLIALFALDDDDFRARFRDTPLWRTKRRGIVRNAAIVLGNQRHRAALPVLLQGMEDPEPLIRGACIWAIGQMIAADDAAIWEQLARRQLREEDAGVRDELRQVLSRRG